MNRVSLSALRTRELAEGWQRKEHGDKHDTSDGGAFQTKFKT
jgi:hypothetical protein